MQKKDDLIPITLQEAEQLMGTLSVDHPEFPGQPMLSATNKDARYGYMLPLDDPSTSFFRTEGEYPAVVIRVPEGASSRSRFGTEFECDGLGWGDDTVYVPGTHQFEHHLKEMDAVAPMKRMRAFLASLPENVRRIAEPNVSIGLRSVQTRVHDPHVEGIMKSKGEDELRIAIHSNPFITFSDRNDGTDGVIVGPPWMLEKFKGMPPEDIARRIMMRALRT